MSIIIGVIIFFLFCVGLGMILMKENEFYETIGRLVVGLSGLAIAFCLFFGVLVPLFKYFIHLL